MNSFRSGSEVSVRFDNLDSLGAPIEPSGASYRVLSETEEVLIETTSVDLTSGAEEWTITIPGQYNSLVDQRAALRVVEFTLETSSGSVVKTHRYVVESNRVVVPGETSFMTFDEALLESHYMLDVDTWLAASEKDQRSSLIQAHQNLLKLRYTLKNSERDSQEYLNLGLAHDPFSVHSVDLNKMSLTEVKEASLRLFKALCKAQIAEADYILGGETIDDKRKIGILSESVGESSNMFRTGKPLQLAVGNKALGHLSGFIDWSYRVRR